MRTKLKLELEELAVDSFQTTTSRRENGTVFGEQCTCVTQCTDPTCEGQATCWTDYSDVSCVETCDGASCEVTCDVTCDSCGPRCGYTALQTNCNEICY